MKTRLFSCMLLIFLALSTNVIAKDPESSKASKASKAKVRVKGVGKNGLVRVAQYAGNKGTFYYAYYDATRRGALIFVDRCGQVHILSESSPDAANEKSISTNLKVNIKDKATAEAYAQVVQNIVQLGKRSAAVNIIRDELYHLNELVMNSSYFNCDLDTSGNILPREKGKAANGGDIMVGGIVHGSLFTPDQILDLYKKSFDDIVLIANAESEANAKMYEAEIARAHADSMKYASGKVIDSIIALKDTQQKKVVDSILKANPKQKDLDDAKKKIEDKDAKIKELENKLTEQLLKSKDDMILLLQKVLNGAPKKSESGK